MYVADGRSNWTVIDTSRLFCRLVCLPTAPLPTALGAPTKSAGHEPTGMLVEIRRVCAIDHAHDYAGRGGPAKPNRCAFGGSSILSGQPWL